MCWGMVMIKWFDADRFLPGIQCDTVLVRYYHREEKDNYDYFLGVYQDGNWFSEELRMPPSDYTVTHWAFIEEPI
jgi:hypothetical protein